MTNGLIISRPVKINKEKEPEIINLRKYVRSGKAASVPGINKVRQIAEFINGNY